MLDGATALHLANRLGFGPAPGELARIRKLGFEAYIDEQLSPDLKNLPAPINAALHKIPSFGKNTYELYKEFWWKVQLPASMAGKPPKDIKRLVKRVSNQIPDQARSARLVRAIASPWRLQEALVEFWFNHFNVYEKKETSRIWVGAYEDEAIRPHTLGRFRDLLLATAKHPVMLIYLDNARNVAPVTLSSGARQRGKATGINENYAREVMELHTLGVDGGYTQSDVTALAHILTGWTVGFDPRETANGAPVKGGFWFAAPRHDPSAQTLLGRHFAGGLEEGEEALLMLAKHPSTAHHVSFKLAQYFVADQPPPTLVSAMTDTFRKTDGDLRAVTRLMLVSKEFRDPEKFGRKFKTPYAYVVSAARATNYDLQRVDPLIVALKQLGQPLYGCVTPDGYACTETTWLDPDAMMRRISFAIAFGNGRFGVAHPGNDSLAPSGPVDADRLIETIGPALSVNARSALAKTAKSLWAGAVLGSPDFMRC